MGVSQIVLVTLFVLIGGIITLSVVSEKYRALMAIIIVLLNAVLTSIPSVLALMGNIQTGVLISPNIPLGVMDLRIDRLSAWFILIINLTSINGAIYGSGYLQAYSHLKSKISFHWMFYTLFHISMIWVCIFDNGVMFLISWELMLLSSVILVIFDHEKKETLKAALNYLIQMHISVVLLTIGYIWIKAETGSFNFSALGDVNSHNHQVWIFVLFFIGFAVKAGFIPFHTWLPLADPAAPAHVSGVMSGVIVKLGIYGIFRIISSLSSDWLIIGEIILSLSVITAIYGILNAAIKYDYYRSLAYCTIENMGIIGMAIGIGLIGIGTNLEILVLFGFSGALLHILNHSLYKSLLFFSCGNVYQQLKTRSIDRLGGLIKQMPITALFFLIGALAIGGLPPFNGFVSEFLIYSGLFQGLFFIKGISHVVLIVLSIIGLVFIGGLSVLTFTKMFGVIFLGKNRVKHSTPINESNLMMQLPQYIIIALMLLIAFFPQFFFNQVVKIITSTFPTQMAPLATNLLLPIQGNLILVGRLSFIFIFVFLIFYLFRSFILKKHPNKNEETWSCGYIHPIAKSQYTGRSYVRTLGNLFSFILKEQKPNIKFPKSQLFPGSLKFSSYYFDFFNVYFITPITKRLLYFFNYFQFVQNGKIQSYVIYGLFFIIIIFIGTALGFIL